MISENCFMGIRKFVGSLAHTAYSRMLRRAEPGVLAGRGATASRTILKARRFSIVLKHECFSAQTSSVFFIALAFLPSTANAEVIITEIMYDLAEVSDSRREWIEVYNRSTNPIMLTDWSVFEQGKNHAIKAITGGGILAPQSYAVIADNPETFKTDHPSFRGQLFDSAFSLNNKGEEIALHDPSDMEHSSFLYNPVLGGNGTGDSLQRIPGSESFAGGIPTPGDGIPEGGLQKSTPPSSRISSSRSNSVSLIGSVSRIVGEPSQTALASFTVPENTPTVLWWLAPLLLFFLSVFGITWSRALKKEEWTIIDETDEKS